MQKFLLRGIELFLALTILAGCSITRNPSSATEPDTIPTESPTGHASQGYERGILTETTYESEFIGVRFELPEKMMMTSQAKLDKKTVFDSEMIYKDKDKTELDYAQALSVCELDVVDRGGFPEITIDVLKVEDASTTEEQYLDNIKQSLARLEDIHYEAAEDYTEIEIGGNKYLTLAAVAASENFEYMQQTMIRKKGDRIIIFFITWMAEDPKWAENILKQFKPY